MGPVGVFSIARVYPPVPQSIDFVSAFGALYDGGFERFGGFRLVTQPTTTNFHDIRMFSLEVLGLHEAILYRVNQEYADLYENREQDSRDLNEPPTNMEGGLGVFSAFNSQRQLFEVVRQE